MLLVDGAPEEPLGTEEEGGGRVTERLSLTATDEGCSGRAKTTFTAVKILSLTWEHPPSLHI